MWEAQRQGRLRVGSCPTARKQRCGEDSGVFGAVTRPNQLGEGCGQAPPHAQTEEEPSLASRLRQAPISGILLCDPSWVSNLGPRGGSTIPGKLSPLGLQGSFSQPQAQLWRETPAWGWGFCSGLLAQTRWTASPGGQDATQRHLPVVSGLPLAGTALCWLPAAGVLPTGASSTLKGVRRLISQTAQVSSLLNPSVTPVDPRSWHQGPAHPLSCVILVKPCPFCSTSNYFCDCGEMW